MFCEDAYRPTPPPPIPHALAPAIFDFQSNQNGCNNPKGNENNQRTNGHVTHLRLFVLSKLMVTLLKNETYGYGSRYSLKKIIINDNTSI